MTISARREKTSLEQRDDCGGGSGGDLVKVSMVWRCQPKYTGVVHQENAFDRSIGKTNKVAEAVVAFAPIRAS